ncbi:type VI secretion system baseplate subunit TssF [Vibrio sp. JC009]|uniref:type VI secretion system baseplate subunit TssF n=1 Tax=Vibrio sp. JC009 TaxID=2912314 RepID=UPI0023AE6DC5|nr:type VI secretion system baseplate subunit TssF [Vibrio sp. JC009]WED22946.1 type VI secretion system baseplate subunit TssF [Vibrio sp. JC009]
MNPQLLTYYNQELQYIKEMGAEFAEEFPKIAGRLGLDNFECADPYVERLLEGFAFLAARVQLKLDAQFPDFTQHLLQTVYPHYLCPTPSMTVVQMQPDLSEAGLAEGMPVPRNSQLKGLMGKNEQTACEYRTAHELTLWPLKVTEVNYLTTLVGTKIKEMPGTKAAIHLRLKTTAGLTFDKLTLDKLPLYLSGVDSVPMHLYEQLLGNCISVVVRPTAHTATWCETLESKAVQTKGFIEEEALLPRTPRSFEGYRLLHEYFSFPERFMFIELTGLEKAVKRCEHDELDIYFLLSQQDNYLEKRTTADNFRLFCTPAINLFPKHCDRVQLNHKEHDLHLVPDRTRPMDFEVYSIGEVTGYGSEKGKGQEFLPLYGARNQAGQHPNLAFYSQIREPRQLSSKQQREGPRSGYIGSEVYISLVDGRDAPYRSDLRQIGTYTLCTNRDLPLHMPVGKGETDFTLSDVPVVESVRCIAGPSKPKPAWPKGESSWRLINHLSLNYLSLTDSDEQQGASSLRELLALYGNVSELSVKKQIEGVRNIQCNPVIKRIPVPGPIALGRGQEIQLTFDEDAFVGSGVFLLGAILEQFFARYASINSFTQTVICTTERGEIMRWPLRTGKRHVL